MSLLASLTQRKQLDYLTDVLEELRATLAYIKTQRQSDAPFDVVPGGYTPDDPVKAAEMLAAYAEAGATWWVESWSPRRGALDAMRRQIRRGPPRG